MRYLKQLLVILAVQALAIGSVIAAVTVIDQKKPKKPTETCIYKSESVDGRNKICIYDCLSGKAAITVESVKLCPVSIKR